MKKALNFSLIIRLYQEFPLSNNVVIVICYIIILYYIQAKLYYAL